MKRSILFSAAFLVAPSTFSQQQIGNSDFEQWETATSELAEPVNWNSFKTATGSFIGFSGQQLDKSTDVRPGSSGSFSAKLTGRDAGFGVIAQGNMTLGRIEMGSITPASSGNYNYSSTGDANFSEAFTEAPDSIYFWAKYTPGNTSHSARVSTIIHNNTNNYKDPNDVSGSNTVATAIYNFPYSGGNWELIKVPFTYAGNPADAAYILATFTTNMTPGVGSASDVLLIDDVELIYYTPSTASTFELTASSVHVSVESSAVRLHSKQVLEGNYAIYSASGAQIQKGTIMPEIDFNSVNGIYFLHLTTSKGSIVKKFIKN
jgi:hypothetical protein